MNHCADNKADRNLGGFWERKFYEMAMKVGFSCTPMQIGHKGSVRAHQQIGKRQRHFSLPDVTIWTYPGQHHEIKHKNPTRDGDFGLEAYRFDALAWFARQTRQDVMYTIHNHDLSGGRDAKENHLEHWFTANICDLDGKQWESSGASYIDGSARVTQIYYWHTDLWIPLAQYWRDFVDVSPLLNTLLARYTAKVIMEANEGRIPATLDEVAKVAEMLAEEAQ